MLNDRLTDELLALESIYPDSVTWSERDGLVALEIVIKVDFEQLRTVQVSDWEEEVVEERNESATRLSRKHNEEAQPTGAQDHERVKAVPPKREKGRKGTHEQNQNQNSLAPTSKRRPQTRTPSISHPATTTLSASPLSPSSTSVPRAPILLSHSKTPRISIAPRSPPPPPHVHELSPVLETLSISANTGPRTLSLRHLPPLRLSIELPSNYPESAGPSKIDLTAEGSWLEDAKRLIAMEKLKSVYVGDECLFGITELLSSASSDFFDTLSLSNPIILRQQSPPSSLVSETPRLSDLLTSFNRSASSALFSTSSHLCPLCFSPRSGSKCLQLESCGCTFCLPCLKDYFSLLITEGMVRSVACPALECVEKRSKWEKSVGGAGSLDEKVELEKPGRVTADEVEKICGSESRKRFEWLKEKIRVESDPSISFCPRESCQAPTPKTDDDKLRVCTACQFAYCVFCRKGWHGTRNACSLPQSNAIVSKYLEANEAEKRTLEARYGSANIKRLVAAFEEEKALQEWFEKNSTSCPGCQIRVEKSHGCNHMTCGKCHAHFCYRCGKSISPAEPYRHFNTPSSICYGKLFDFSPGQEPGVEEWIGELIAQDEGGH
ncbi:hypothetical protein JCM3765_005676 [Sporobolomyces pararoseus]